MKTFKQLRHHLNTSFLDSDANDTNAVDSDEKEIKQTKHKMLYASDLKSRMQRAYKRNKRQQKIDKLQSTGEWPGLQ